MDVFKRLFVIILLLFFFTAAVSAQTEEELDEEMFSDDAEKKGKQAEKKSRWEIYGFLESTGHFGPGVRADIKPGVEVVKMEARAKLNFKYTRGHFYAKTVLDIYFYPRLDNHANPRKSGGIEAQEMYIGGGDKFQFKIGKQLFSWGAADLFPITNYFDQRDMREFIAIDKEDKYEGVLGISLKYLIGDFALEAAFTPVHNPALLPAKDNFWSFIPGVPVRADPLPANLKYASYAFRGGGTIGGLDFHLSYYNGINSNLVFKPVPGPVFGIKPYYGKVQTFGIDLSFAVGKLALRAEGTYTPAMFAISAGNPEAPVQTAHYLSYVIGADYNLWGQNGNILIEWMQGKYLKNAAGYRSPFLTDMLLVRLTDKFFDRRLEVELAALFRLKHSTPGYAITADLTWKVRGEFSISTGAYFFVGNKDELFSLFDKKDMVYFKARLEF
ncbi:MAG: hypothetical protein GY950_15295 [bacterium]|nr:hypothetical protein [bacterium]